MGCAAGGICFVYPLFETWMWNVGVVVACAFLPCCPWRVADDYLYGEVCLSLGALAVAAHGWHGGLVGVEFERVGEDDPFERLVVVVGPAGHVALFDFDGGDVIGK